MSILSISQPEDAHRVTVVQDGASYLVRCNECPRLFRVDHDGEYEVLVWGDMSAGHSFSLGGVMELKSVKVCTDSDDNIERLLDGIDIS